MLNVLSEGVHMASIHRGAWTGLYGSRAATTSAFGRSYPLVCCVCFQCSRLEPRALHGLIPSGDLGNSHSPLPAKPPDAALPPCQGEYPPAFPTEAVPLCVHI